MNTIHPFPAPTIDNDATLLAVSVTTRESDLDGILVGRRSILRVMHLWSSSTLSSSSDSTVGTEDEDSMSDIADIDFVNDDDETEMATSVAQSLRQDEEGPLKGTVCSMRPQANQVCERPVSQKNVLLTKPTGTNTTLHKDQEPSLIRRSVTSRCVVPASPSLSFSHAPLTSSDALSVGIRKPRWFLGRVRFQLLNFSTSQRSIKPTLAGGTEEWELV